ncbi:hypothetical protein Nepgr_015113 [Nepenthes gracilis]|uniref:DUF4042 domain-containing protein n=1 Tax=Nepenthes gracilis TaxID=150966 RepID=A0AAD3XQ50_NEPGR|nr:hypothetical protein Nepgr_015113 [Nepenthes gracilis]
MAVEPTSALPVRTWRTAFLTLRDEIQSCPTGVHSVPLLHDIILSHSKSLISAATYLPPDEVTSDLMYVLNLAASVTISSEDPVHAFALICQLIHDVAFCVPLELSSSAWTKMLDSFGKLLEFFLRNADKKRVTMGNAATMKAIMDCLDTTKRLICSDRRRCSLSDNIQLVKFLLQVVCVHVQSYGSSYSYIDQMYNADSAIGIPRDSSSWKVQASALSMIGEAFLRVGCSFPMDIWQSTIEVLRKVMDALPSKTLFVEDIVLSRFYASLLNCLHLVLVNRKGLITDHVAAFVAILRLFLVYGLTNVSLSSCQKKNRDQNALIVGPSSRELTRVDSGPYRPPHLRRKNGSLQQLGAQASKLPSDHVSSQVSSSSDSDYSDSDVALKEFDNLHGCKARVAAIICIQDLCEADPKAFTAQWMMLLPISDVLQPRKNEATLMTCLLFDPYMKARLASASAIAAMLEGPSSVALQVAEYRESATCGSYLSFSSSLGHILMQLHTGVLFLIQHETHMGLLTSVFKILTLLISSTPYSRMPGELLPTVLSSLRARINEGFPFRSDQTGLQAITINCLGAAVSASPSSLHVNEMFQAEISSGSVLGQGGPSVLSALFQHAAQVTNPTISLEALQTLRAVCHSYPNIMVACWRHVSTLVYGFLRPDSVEVPSRKGTAGNGVASLRDKVITAAVKVLDECLRALSGFRGTEDAFGDNLVETPFISDCIRDKKISSAPSYALENLEVSTQGSSNECPSGSMEWHEAIEKHIVLTIFHTSAIVRAASITCFAGITSFVFFSLKVEKQDFVLSSCINAAVGDEAPSVRSAACRAIGVIACFPGIFKSVEILHKFINAAEINTCHHSISVRIPASWAIANICASLHPCSVNLESNRQVVASLAECALQLTKDGDKIKSNAVRALGNLGREIPFSDPNKPKDCEMLSSIHCMEDTTQHPLNSSQSDSLGENVHLLDRIVQSFLSCVTTGNVKVQWNVCHALSNLFLNETLGMQHMDWAPSVYSILLLLLRDSSNYKIRIQAAAALAVPSTVLDYGRSFSDVVQGVEHILENLGSEQNLTPTSFKYKIALEKQLTSTLLHLLGLCSSSVHRPLEDFLLKKVSFLEEWFKGLCSSLEGTSIPDDNEVESNRKQKVGLISKAIQALVQVYEGKNQLSYAWRLEKVLDYLL